MQAGKQQEPHVMNRLRVYNSKDNLVWNDQVLLAIQRMGYNLDSVKQVPHPCMHTCRGRGSGEEGGGGGDSYTAVIVDCTSVSESPHSWQILT